MLLVLYDNPSDFYVILGPGQPDTYRDYVHLSHTPYTLNFEQCFKTNRTHLTKLYVLSEIFNVNMS